MKRYHKASQVIEKVIEPILNQLGGTMSPQCPFHKRNDVVGYFKEMSFAGRRPMWRCKKCKTGFHIEEQLNEHLMAEHKHEIPEDTRVCLDDYCDILHCDWDLDESHCDIKQMEKVKHRCEAIFHKCFDSPENNFVYNALSSKFCDPLHCHGTNPVAKYVKTFSKKMSKFSFLFFI